MMTKLSCNASNCVNNVGGLCSARIIHVVGENAHISRGTECETFEENNIGSAIKGITNMNIGGELRQAFESERIVMSPEIVCDAARCIYNVNRSCNAESIQVYGPDALSSSNTECETFKES